MVSTNLLIKSKLLSSNMLTRMRPMSRFFWNKSVRDLVTSSSNDMKKEHDRMSSFISVSGLRREDFKYSFERNTVISDQGVKKVEGTGALEGYVGEFYRPDTTYKICIEVDMKMDSAELKLHIPKLKGEKSVFNVKLNVTD